MIWLTLAIFCYVLFALNAIGDKFLLSGTSLKNPITYTISVGLAGVLIVVAIPVLGIPVSPSGSSFYLALASGVSFVFALLPFFAGLKKYQATSIVPIVGAVQPISAIIFGTLFFHQAATLSIALIAVLTLLIMGGILVSAEKGGKMSVEAIWLGVLSGSLFALSFVLAKQVYIHESLWYGLFWSRLGGALLAIIFLITMGKARQEIFAQPKEKSATISNSQANAMFIVTQGVGALAGIMQQAAIFAAPVFAVAIVNALQGIQYVFIFILSLMASMRFPKVFKDRYTNDTSYKMSGIVLIIIGIFILVYHVK